MVGFYVVLVREYRYMQFGHMASEVDLPMVLSEDQ
jgi:hypothetical protein